MNDMAYLRRIALALEAAGGPSIAIDEDENMNTSGYLQRIAEAAETLPRLVHQSAQAVAHTGTTNPTVLLRVPFEGGSLEADGAIVGTVTLKNVSRTMGHAELGYHVAAGARRRGIGRRAVSDVLDLAFESPDFHRIWVTVSVDNLPSQALARRLGFQYEGRLREHYRILGHWADQLVFGLLRDDWERTHA